MDSSKFQIDSKILNRKIFLEEFTRELIKNSVGENEIERLKRILDLKKGFENKKIKREINIKIVRPLIKKENLNKEKSKIKENENLKERSGFKILETILPTPEIIYPKIEKKEKNINWGPLAPLIEDSSVKIIEGEPNKKIIAKSEWGEVKEVNIKMKNSEINNLFGEISNLKNIPAKGDVFRANISGKIISAENTEGGIKFIITKIPKF